MTIYAQTTYLAAALGCASIASVYDIRSRRIPNLLTGPSILFGVILHLLMGGAMQAGLSVLAGLIAGGAFFLIFVAGGMGAGDVKLITAVGCLAGTAYIKEVLIATVLVGSVMGIVLALCRGRLGETIRNVVTLVQHHRVHGLATHPELNVMNPSTLRLPYAIPIAAGCLVALRLSSGNGLLTL